MHSNRVVLLARTQAILLDLLGRTSQASQVIKVIPSMDGKMHLRLQDQCMQMGLKTQVCLGAMVQCNRDPFWLANARVHVDLEVIWLPVSGSNGPGGGGDLFEVAILFIACFPALFCCCVSNRSLLERESVGRYC